MLRISHATATDLLGEGIEEGQDLLQRASLIGDQSDYESWKTTRKQWIERTAEALARIYDGPQEALDFKSEASCAAGGQQWQIEYQRDSNCVRAAIDILIFLQTALERLSAPDSEPERDDFAGAEHDRDQDNDADSEPERDEFAGAEHERDHDSHTHAERERDDSAADFADAEHDRDQDSHADAERERDDSAADFADAEHERAPAVSAAEPAPADLAPALSHGDDSEDHANGSMSSLPVPRSSAGARTDQARQVFLVHGRNDEVRQAVAGLLERTGSHEVTILNERPSDRRMLVEQFVEHPAELRYAVVLLTADDVGAPRIDSDREPYFSPRARQGVVFEMGFLVAALTPRCICVLYEDGVELPFDLDGIVYVRLDLAGTWQSKLLLHLRDAGFDYDLNRLAPI